MLARMQARGSPWGRDDRRPAKRVVLPVRGTAEARPVLPLRSAREKESAIALPMPLATLVTPASVFLKFIVRFFRWFA
jgi:hypothetical protein